MGVVIEGSYIGSKKTRLVHGPSGAVLQTGAPKDNGGDGSLFSPTDLVAAALGACLMTIIGMAAEKHGLDLTGMHMQVEKEMQSNPRRIARLTLQVHLPASLTPDARQRLEAAGRACPVAQSLHPDTVQDVQFLYDL